MGGRNLFGRLLSFLDDASTLRKHPLDDVRLGRGVVVAVANHVLPSRRGSLNPAFHLSAHLAGLALLLLPWGVRRRMPSEQGRGHARTLLEAIRERSRSDPLSTGVAISTYSESNVRLYERLGFEVTGQSRRDSTPVWALFAAH